VRELGHHDTMSLHADELLVGFYGRFFVGLFDFDDID
jgi:hypothetical protein